MIEKGEIITKDIINRVLLDIDLLKNKAKSIIPSYWNEVTNIRNVFEKNYFTNGVESLSYGNGVYIMGTSRYTQSSEMIDGNVVYSYSSESRLLYSYDILNWQVCNTPFESFSSTTSNKSCSVNSICFDESLQKFIAVTNSGKIVYSSNGINWSISNQNIFTKNILSVCTNNRGTFVVVGDEGVAYSTDGISWTKIDTSNLSTQSFSLCNYCKNLDFPLFVIYGNGYSYYSMDGISWKSLIIFNSITNFKLSFLYDGNNILLGISPTKDIYYSDSSFRQTWKDASLNLSTLTTGTLESILFNGHFFIFSLMTQIK